MPLWVRNVQDFKLEYQLYAEGLVACQPGESQGFTKTSSLVMEIDWDYATVHDREGGEAKIPVFNADQNLKHLRKLLLSTDRIVIDLTQLESELRSAKIRSISMMLRGFPDATAYVHGCWTWREAYGLRFRHADVDPVGPARKGQVVTPAGRIMEWQLLLWETDMADTPVGIDPKELGTVEMRVAYNILSAREASKFWHANDLVLTAIGAARSRRKIDDTFVAAVLNDEMPPRPTNRHFRKPKHRNTTPLDLKFDERPESEFGLCNSCKYSWSCIGFREGSTCIMDPSMKELATFFDTRDPTTILDGIRETLRIDAERLTRAVEWEKGRENPGEPSKEVTNLSANIQRNGRELAKLLDPKLRSSRLALDVNHGTVLTNEAAEEMNPQQLASHAIGELEQAGVDRTSITQELIKAYVGAVDVEQREAIVRKAKAIPTIEAQ